MDIDAAFPSKYIKASDLQGREVTVAMSQVVIEAVGRNNSDKKPVLYFQGKEKGLVLNKTNSRAISAVYGGDTSRWMGQPVVLYPAMTDFSGEQVPCIRIRAAYSGAAQAHQSVPQFQAPQPQQYAPPPTHQGQPAFHGAGTAGPLPPPTVTQSAPQRSGQLDDDIPF